MAALQPSRELKDLLTLRLVRARRSHHEQKCKNEGFLHLGKPLSKGHRAFSKPASFLQTRFVLNTSSVWTCALFSSRSFIFISRHQSAGFSILHSFSRQLLHDCHGFIITFSQFANGAADGTRTRTSRRRRHADTCMWSGRYPG